VRILSIHADRFWYRTTQKTHMAEQTDKREDGMKDCVVLFCCVEKLDEKNPEYVIRNATNNILARLAKLKVSQVMIYPYAHLGGRGTCLRGRTEMYYPSGPRGREVNGR